MQPETERKGDWICTFSGNRFWPLDPRAEEIDPVDIAHALSLQCRWTGHVRTFYSIAEHSCRVADAIYKSMKPSGHRIMATLWGLLHDASEAYLCDVARPVKVSPEMAPYREAERRLELTIAQRFNLPTTMPDVVKHFDEVLLVTEARDLMASFDNRWRHWEVRHLALPAKITPWDHEYAERHYLRLLTQTLEEWQMKRAIWQRGMDAERHEREISQEKS